MGSTLYCGTCCIKEHSPAQQQFGLYDGITTTSTRHRSGHFKLASCWQTQPHNLLPACAGLDFPNEAHLTGNCPREHASASTQMTHVYQYHSQGAHCIAYFCAFPHCSCRSQPWVLRQHTLPIILCVPTRLPNTLALCFCQLDIRQHWQVNRNELSASSPRTPYTLREIVLKRISFNCLADVQQDGRICVQPLLYKRFGLTGNHATAQHDPMERSLPRPVPPDAWA